MKIRDKDLVQVKSRDELRAGMTVVRMSCPCGKARHVSMLLRSAASLSRYHLRHDGLSERCYAKAVWIESDPHQPAWTCFCYVLSDGRLFRLRDLDESDEQAETVRRPETVSAR